MTSSLIGYHGFADAPACSASKWGLRGVSKSAAMELQECGIRVNTICPGLVMMPFVAGSEDFIDALGTKMPMVRGAKPKEIAAVVLFLVSDDSSYMTAHDIAVDGGFTDFGGYNAVLKHIMTQPGQKI